MKYQSTDSFPSFSTLGKRVAHYYSSETFRWEDHDQMRMCRCSRDSNSSAITMYSRDKALCMWSAILFDGVLVVEALFGELNVVLAVASTEVDGLATELWILSVEVLGEATALETTKPLRLCPYWASIEHIWSITYWESRERSVIVRRSKRRGSLGEKWMNGDVEKGCWSYRRSEQKYILSSQCNIRSCQMSRYRLKYNHKLNRCRRYNRCQWLTGGMRSDIGLDAMPMWLLSDRKRGTYNARGGTESSEAQCLEIRPRVGVASTKTREWTLSLWLGGCSE